MSGPKRHPAAAQLQRPASSPSTNHPPQLVTRLLWICSPSSVKCCTTCPGRVAKAVRDCSGGPVRGTSTPSETQPTWMRLPGRLAELSFTNVYLLLTVLSIEISGGVTLSSSVRLSYGRGVGRGGRQTVGGHGHATVNHARSQPTHKKGSVFVYRTVDGVDLLLLLPVREVEQGWRALPETSPVHHRNRAFATLKLQQHILSGLNRSLQPITSSSLR